jgi:hypothetical protein
LRYALSGSVTTGPEAFVRLALLCAEFDAERAGPVTLDCQALRWCDGNLCAALAACLAPTVLRLGSVPVSLPTTEVRTFWQRNGFGSHLHILPWPDSYGSAIPFRLFAPTAHREAHRYVHESFTAQAGVLPEMTPVLLNRMCGQLCEVFDNAFEHADSRHGVFCCGQHFPKKNRLAFTIADAGIGFAGSASRRRRCRHGRGLRRGRARVPIGVGPA